MTTRTTSSSSTSETEVTTTGILGAGPMSTQHRESPAVSQTSGVATGTPYDTVSLATTTNTGFTSATNFSAGTYNSQQPIAAGGIPVIPPPTLQQRQQLSGSNVNVTNQPIQVDVASAHQQYQQQKLQSEISPY